MLSNAGEGYKRMFVGELHAEEIWTDLLGWTGNPVKISNDGFGEFRCSSVSVSVFVNKEAKGRQDFGKWGAEIRQLTKQ